MKILVVGSGGREHAVIRKLAESKEITHLYCAPGNGGIRAQAQTVDIAATDVEKMVDFAKQEAIDFVVVTPDDPLVLGMADAMEAVIGAVFLDGGMGEAKRLVLHAVEGHIERAVRNVNTKDYKTLLQEHVQKQHQGNVTYDLIDTSGPDHQRVFTLQAVIAGEPKGVGSGGSKQEAGQRAAKATLEGLGLL